MERLWKSTRLQVPRIYLKELRTEFNTMVKCARVSYFTTLISSSRCNPKVLYVSVNNIVSPVPPAVPVHSNKDCCDFLSFFVDKVSAVMSSITLSPSSPPVCSTQHSILSHFLPVSPQDAPLAKFYAEGCHQYFLSMSGLFY